MNLSLCRRLARIEHAVAAQRRVHYLFREMDETDDLVQARIRAMIASGEARPSDRFVIFSWSGSAANEADSKSDN